MASYYLCPLSAIFQYFSDIGVVLNGGLINTYEAGTTTPTTTWTDSTGDTENANPIELASNGRLPNVQIWQEGGVPIKVVITDADNNQLGPDFDNIYGINDPAATLASLADAASGSGADLVANAVRSYDLFSTMRAANVPDLTSGQTLIVVVEGGTAVGDANAGTFYWSATSDAADDGATVIKPTGAGSTGRYLRLSYSSQISSGTFVGTVYDAVNSAAGTFSYDISGSLASLKLGGAILLGSSTDPNLYIKGVPAAIVPASQRTVPAIVSNGGNQYCPAIAAVTISSGIQFFVLNTGMFFGTGTVLEGGFSVSGSKGLRADFALGYPL